MAARLPPPVRPGDRVGIAALSGVVDGAALSRGLQRLRSLGFEPVLAENLVAARRPGGEGGLFAGDDEERLDGFHRLCRDESIRAIVFARGGHGLLRLLPAIDWSLLQRHPRAYVGYSDLTPFLIQVVQRCDLVAFHGPMVTSDLARADFSTREAESLLAALGGRVSQALPLVCPPAMTGRGPSDGRLLGGCLSLMVAVLGTPWAAELDDCLLFLEEVGEPDYRLDRMLTHLDLSGSLRRLRGLVLGHLPDGGPEQGRESASPAVDCAWRHHVGRLAARYEWPWAEGLEAGHAAPNLTLPLGRLACIDPRRAVLEIE